MGEADWRAAIERAPAPATVQAHTFLRRLAGGLSWPVLLSCDDHRDYVVKGPQVGRALVADQIVGRLGALIGAPVADVALVDVSDDLVGLEPQLSHFVAGLSHGSALIPDVVNLTGAHYTNERRNRDRYASLAILYGWALAADRQFLFGGEPEHLVHSADHGEFLAPAGAWSRGSLAAAPAPEADPEIVDWCRLTDQELSDAVEPLLGVQDRDIVTTVASVPASWGIDREDRLALVRFFATRRDQLLATLLK